MNIKHTPTPWWMTAGHDKRGAYYAVGSGDRELATFLNREDALLVKNAVNSHADLVVALEELLRAADKSTCDSGPCAKARDAFDPGVGIDTMQWIYDDGGRQAAGYKGIVGDCVCRAIAIATCKPYQEVYDALNELGTRERKCKRKRGKSNARTGVYKQTIRRYMESLGWVWHPTMQIGSGCKVHLAPGELPMGRLVVSVSRHTVAVINGLIRDTHDPSRDGTRCVYGYFAEE